jgi:hypothetical protein
MFTRGRFDSRSPQRSHESEIIRVDGAMEQIPHRCVSDAQEKAMKSSLGAATVFTALSLAALLQPANAGLGAYSSPQRTRCENQASAKIAMWQWFARQDFVNRCVAATGNTGGSKAKGKGRKVSAR